jgi:hypothetical protein
VHFIRDTVIKVDLNVSLAIVSCVLTVNLNRCLASLEILLIIIPIPSDHLLLLLRFTGFLQVQDRFVGKTFITLIPAVLRIPLTDQSDDDCDSDDHDDGHDQDDDFDEGDGEDDDDDDYRYLLLLLLLLGGATDHGEDRSGIHCYCRVDGGGFASNTCPKVYVLGNILMSTAHQGVYCYETIQMFLYHSIHCCRREVNFPRMQ